MSMKSWIIWKGKDLVVGFLSSHLWPRTSAAALVIKDEKLLAIDTGDYLMLPGGGLEKGERFEQAAKREALEETGYRVKILEKLEQGMNSVGGVEVLFRAELLDEKQFHDGNWEGEPVWIDIDEIRDKTWRHDRNVKDILKGKQS